MTTNNERSSQSGVAADERVASTGRRPWSRAGLVLTTAVAALWIGTAEAATIVRVEEDWRVEIGTPDPLTNAPQVTTVMSPSSSLKGLHGVFELNHFTLPSYVAGGMQIQRWNGDTVQDHCNFPNSNVAATTDEVVTYTTAMEVSGGNLTFEIKNGTSSTWGTFGGQGYLKTTATSSLTDLSLYDPATSVKYSKIGFASFRVKKFVRTEIRYYSTTGLVSTDTTDTIVHQYSGGT